MKIEAQQNCGCCTIEMNFKSVEAAELAFEKAGLKSSATIIDDDNVKHTGVDTFYGFWQQGQEHLKNFEKLISILE